MAAPLKFVQVAARARHTATVILIHGLGDSGHGWAPVAQMFSQNPAFHHVKWVLPHAPDMPVTANQGMIMPAWFDIAFIGSRDEDERGMLKTVAQINKIITEEVDSGIPADRIVVSGFSQGAAMSLLTGMTSERKLAGIAVLSGWLPLPDKFKSMITAHATSLPIFWGHGRKDTLVEYSWGEQSVNFLRQKLNVPEYSVSSGKPTGLLFKTYDELAHSTTPQELADFQSWLNEVIPESS